MDCFEKVNSIFVFIGCSSCQTSKYFLLFLHIFNVCDPFPLKFYQRHILRERQRKKEEQEAEVEEERLRKEREARERQDVMTLGETRDQIQIYSTKLEELQNEKKLLFLQLKKVLNEDDRKKRQLHTESKYFR